MIDVVDDDARNDVRLRLAIGVIAHRDLVAEEEPALRQSVREFLRRLRADFPDLPLRMISALAEGGDQLAAEEALALGIELVVPLPMPQDEYEKDFSDPAALLRLVYIYDVVASFIALLDHPASVGGFVSSGCFRMTNADVLELYEKVRLGAKVIVE